eukprot:2789542-Ditylum_brightwellii.AAC.1
MKENNVDVFAFAETNIVWTPQTQNRAKKITEQVYNKNYRIETSSSNEIAVNQYQPGGTMIGVVGKQQGRILQGNQDKLGMGRWSYVVTAGKSKSIHTTIQNSAGEGNRTAKPKKAVVHRHHTANKRVEKGRGNILLTDANSELGDTEFGDF